MGAHDLWSQSLYLAPYDYIIDTHIVEYDMEKANINVLCSKGAISRETRDGLLNVPKMSREVAIGRMIRREPQLQEILAQGIMEAREVLFQKLHLKDENVLSIKNDAVYVIYDGVVPSIQPVQIDEFVRFRPKGTYSSFYKIFRKEFYYDYDPVTQKEGLDIKGIGDYGIETGKSFICLLCDIFYIALVQGPAAALKKCNEVYLSFIKKEYPIEYYRRLDSQAQYDIVDLSQYCKFQADMLAPSDIYAVDISYNASVIRLLISYFTQASC